MKKAALFVLLFVLGIGASAQDNKTQAILFKVMLNGQEQGPYNLAQLKPMIQNGQLSRNTMVWQQGMSGWSEAELVPEINELFKAVPSAQVSSSADTIKSMTEKQVKVKNAYYYKKKSIKNMSFGAGELVIGVLFIGISATGSSSISNTGIMVIGGAAATLGAVMLGIGISQRIKAKKMSKTEGKITLGPATSGIGLAINF